MTDIKIGQVWTASDPNAFPARVIRVDGFREGSHVRYTVTVGGRVVPGGTYRDRDYRGFVAESTFTNHFRLMSSSAWTSVRLNGVPCDPTGKPSPETTPTPFSLESGFFEYLEANRPGWRSYPKHRLMHLLQTWTAAFEAGRTAR